MESGKRPDCHGHCNYSSAWGLKRILARKLDFFRPALERIKDKKSMMNRRVKRCKYHGEIVSVWLTGGGRGRGRGVANRSLHRRYTKIKRKLNLKKIKSGKRKRDRPTTADVKNSKRVEMW